MLFIIYGKRVLSHHWEKKANKWVKIHFFVGWWRFDFYVHILLVSMRVNSDAILNVAIIVQSNIDIFMASPMSAGVVLSKKLRFCMNFYFSEFLFSDVFWKKCHSFDKTEIKANFTSIHVNYDENGKTGKLLFVRQSIESRALLKLI